MQYKGSNSQVHKQKKALTHSIIIPSWISPVLIFVKLLFISAITYPFSMYKHTNKKYSITMQSHSAGKTLGYNRVSYFSLSFSHSFLSFRQQIQLIEEQQLITIKLIILFNLMAQSVVWDGFLKAMWILIVIKLVWLRGKI